MLSINFALTLKSPMHIGALSPAGTSAVRGIIKDYDGWPYIPASVFKGRLRHTVEKLARGLKYPVCETHRNMCRDVTLACPACLIFGSAWIPGQVRFEDIQLSGPEEYIRERENKEFASTTQRYGVSLSRTRKVAEDRLLYTMELFEPVVPLIFSGMVTEIPSHTEAAWLVGGIHLLDSLGSSRSRGLGWLEGQAQVQDENKQIIALGVLQAYIKPYEENRS